MISLPLYHVTYVETLSPKLDRDKVSFGHRYHILRIKTLPSSQFDYESIGLGIAVTLEVPTVVVVHSLKTQNYKWLSSTLSKCEVVVIHS